MEERIELKDPDHPEAKEAAEATARLLIEAHRIKQDRSHTEGISASEIESAQVGDAEGILAS